MILNLTVYSAGTSAIVSLMPDPSETPFRHRNAEKRYILQKHRFFGNFSPEHIERLASCIIAKPVTRATTIFAKGDPGSSLFAISKGSVKITRSSVDGHDAIFNLIGEGAIFGEIALLDG